MNAPSKPERVITLAEAIREGIKALQPGDVLVIAGKGHESGQTVAGITRPFSDRDEARRWA